MSAVLALKRNSSTVRYCFEADAEPGVLPRALELLAKRGWCPPASSPGPMPIFCRWNRVAASSPTPPTVSAAAARSSG